MIATHVKYQLTLTETQRAELREILIREIIDARVRMMAAGPDTKKRAKHGARYMAAHQLLELIDGAPF